MKNIGSVFVTGGTGFIGSKLIEVLLSNNLNVHVLTRQEYKKIRSLGNNRLHFHYYDGSASSVLTAIDISKPKIVFHLASLFVAEHQSEDIDKLIESNILLCTQLLEAMAKNNVKYIVNATTCWKYYESNQYNPANLYAATKKAAEDIIEYYHQAESIKYLNLLIFDTYGKGDTRCKFINILINACDRSEDFLMSAGEQYLNLTHVHDVAEAFVTAGTHLIEGRFQSGEFAVRGSEEFKLIDLASMLVKLRKSNTRLIPGSRAYRKREVMSVNSFIPTLPGWTSKKTIREEFALCDQD